MYQLVTVKNISGDDVRAYGFEIKSGCSVHVPLRFFENNRHVFEQPFYSDNYDDIVKGTYDGLRFATENNQVAIDGLCEYVYEMGGGEIYLPAADYGGSWTLQANVTMRGDGYSSSVEKIVLVGEHTGIRKLRITG